MRKLTESPRFVSLKPEFAADHGLCLDQVGAGTTGMNYFPRSPCRVDCMQIEIGPMVFFFPATIPTPEQAFQRRRPREVDRLTAVIDITQSRLRPCEESCESTLLAMSHS